VLGLHGEVEADGPVQGVQGGCAYASLPDLVVATGYLLSLHLMPLLFLPLLVPSPTAQGSQCAHLSVPSPARHAHMPVLVSVPS
jgi:hypothetical protein